jgi:hypothetical protein
VGRKTLAGKLEAGIPVRRRTEILARLIAASQLVIGGALLRVREHGVGLVDLLHVQLGIRLLGNVRVILARELAEGLLEIVRRDIARHPQGLVILELHPASY